MPEVSWFLHSAWHVRASRCSWIYRCVQSCLVYHRRVNNCSSPAHHSQASSQHRMIPVLIPHSTINSEEANGSVAWVSLSMGWTGQHLGIWRLQAAKGTSHQLLHSPLLSRLWFPDARNQSLRWYKLPEDQQLPWSCAWSTAAEFSSTGHSESMCRAGHPLAWLKAHLIPEHMAGLFTWA